MKTDIEIARSTRLERIEQVAEKMGIPAEELEHYGKYIAKVPLHLIGKPKGKLILVTAITATKAGIGKTTVSIGLALGLNKIGKKAAVAHAVLEAVRPWRRHLYQDAAKRRERDRPEPRPRHDEDQVRDPKAEVAPGTSHTGLVSLYADVPGAFYAARSVRRPLHLKTRVADAKAGAPMRGAPQARRCAPPRRRAAVRSSRLSEHPATLRR